MPHSSGDLDLDQNQHGMEREPSVVEIF